MRLTAAAALFLAAAALTGCSIANDEAGDDPKPAPATSRTATPTGDGIPLAEAISRLTIAAEQTDGYERTLFKHWTTGANADDGCTTREEVLIAEAIKKPQQGAGCKLTGGEWLSYYDEVTVTDPSALDLDHMIALEEGWSSGAHAWTADRREAFANDLGAERSLVAVTAKTNRSKSARDPADWLPPSESAWCTYAADWTATKLRWALTADQAEQTALLKLADGCPDTTLTYELAP